MSFPLANLSHPPCMITISLRRDSVFAKSFSPFSELVPSFPLCTMPSRWDKCVWSWNCECSVPIRPNSTPRWLTVRDNKVISWRHSGKRQVRERDRREVGSLALLPCHQRNRQSCRSLSRRWAGNIDFEIIINIESEVGMRWLFIIFIIILFPGCSSKQLLGPFGWSWHMDAAVQTSREHRKKYWFCTSEYCRIYCRKRCELFYYWKHSAIFFQLFWFVCFTGTSRCFGRFLLPRTIHRGHTVLQGKDTKHRSLKNVCQGIKKTHQFSYLASP